ncbi:DinB family protein [Deinococcus maricopensis]|uniref:DinB-like domain-containing protein n=1 Tax=Deinococcus maricopensis (strain DSM 21211 / LMG 22137 / NRRL B-23946 / LB-34) TaxID=709986 RepID=E8U7P2_DEIML|nr:DinB family protein [Deinococcus maricopensis]ADV67081.1 hypothetical protein Deima_1432 [Deinococcus maricopensis DSM 21211]
MPLHDPAFLVAFGATPDLARARLQHELTAYQAALAAHARPLDEPLPGRPWSAAQLTEHVALVNASVARVLRLLASDRDLSAYPDTPAAVVDGRVQAPAPLQPGENLPAVELEARWAAANEQLHGAVGSVDTTDPARTFPHPAFGQLDALGWLRMAAFHTRHHRKQLEGAFGA